MLGERGVKGLFDLRTKIDGFKVVFSDYNEEETVDLSSLEDLLALKIRQCHTLGYLVHVSLKASSMRPNSKYKDHKSLSHYHSPFSCPSIHLYTLCHRLRLPYVTLFPSLTFRIHFPPLQTVYNSPLTPTIVLPALTTVSLIFSAATLVGSPNMELALSITAFVLSSPL